MGKSIVHCALCGGAVHEGGGAVTIDHRTYCSSCAPSPHEPARSSVPRKGSTSRIPVSSSTGTTRRIPVAQRRRSPAPALAVGALAVASLVALLLFAFSKGGSRPRAVEPEKTAEVPPPRAAATPAPVPPPAPEPKKAPDVPVVPGPTAVAGTTPPETPKPAPAAAPEPAGTLKPTLSSPADGGVFDAPATITISAEAPGAGVKVEFYEGATKLGESLQPPYTMVWRDVPAGNYSLTARATGRGGESLISLPVSIRVTVSVVAAVPEPRKPVPVDFGVDPRRVADAIARGAAFLKAAGVKESMNPAAAPGLAECPELILWTLVHAGVPENDPDFVKLFNFVLSKKLERTYSVALQAMILEEVQRVKYQVRIAQCAQFLMDAQCPNGQWSYGGPAQIGVPTTGLKADVASGGGAKAAGPAGERVKPKVVRKITSLRKMQEGPPTGDNSNSQYAALGLRACHDAGIVIPKTLILRAQTWWRISQHDEESKAGEPRPAVSTGPGEAAGPAGWCYGPKDHGHAVYSSMTAGAVGSVAIWNFLQDEKNWRKDPTLQKGIAWLDRHFSVSGNEGPSEHVADRGWMVYYYLYALERAGVLAATETFGPHKWYVEGAEAILVAQKADGSWLSPLPHGDRSVTTNQVWDSCFAILFLKRATRPLEDVASTDLRGRK